MHKLFGTIAAGLLALNAVACSQNASLDSSPDDEQVGVARQKSTENPSFPSADSGETWVWDSYGDGGIGADYVTMSNTLDQYWEVEGVGYWPSYDGESDSQANIDSCESNYISFYSYYYCDEWFTWASEQIVAATAYTSDGKIYLCEATATVGPEYFSCATEWETDTFTSPTGDVYTYAIANPL